MRVHHLTAAVLLASAIASVGQQAPDPETVLQQTRERLLKDLARLPRYTCVQSITRQYFGSPARRRTTQCSDLIAAHDARTRDLPMEAWDRLRLEVAIAEGGNVYSWVGAPRFEAGALEKLAGQGPLGSGDFGVFLSEIFRLGVVEFQGEETVAGKRVLKFSFDLPIGRSGYKIRMNEGWTLTAYGGTFRLDAVSTDIESLTVRTAELPPGEPICLATSEVDYGRTLIHDSMTLIPRETRLRTLNSDDTETLSVTTYASCREYASKSRMLLEAPQNSGISPADAPPLPPSGLPAGLHFETRITTPIDSDTSWAGDPIEAVLRSPLRDTKHAILAPAGALLHGRLVRVQHQSNPLELFQIGVQLESIEIGGKTVPLRATRYFVSNPGSMFRFDMARTSGNEFSTGIAIFILTGPRLHLKNFDSEWITLAPSSGIASDADQTP